ncbi:MFS transporter [Streptomyces noursei]|uniref:MFS transporter n=1 Tax=Streptomyces noursei TaxID=1971 RepID=UPI0023B845D5|nr:MFS transporter [Streptomyces noursei]
MSASTPASTPHHASGAAPDAALGPAPAAPRRGVTTLIGLTELCYAAAVSLPLVLGLGQRIQQLAPHDKTTVLGLVTALGGVTTILVTPLAGHLSDHCTSRFGRRRPWILGGAATGLLGLFLLALAPNTTFLALGWMVAVAGYQTLAAALTAVVVDQYPPHRRTRVAGTFSMCNVGGVVPAMLLATTLRGRVTLQFTVCGALALVAAALLCLALADRRLAAGDRPRVSARSLAASLLVLPRAAHDFRILWTQRLLVSFGYAMISAYSLYYVQDRLHLNAEAGARLVGTTTLLTTLCSGLTAYLAGRWAARTGRSRSVLLWATLVMGAMLAVKAVTADLTAVYLYGAVFGGALGAYYAVDLGLVSQVLPDERDAGRYLGAFALAKNLPMAIGPALAPALLTVGHDPLSGGANYLVLFLVCTAVTAVAAVLVPRLWGNADA